eukprot:scaffold138611_cov33-Tisochrysis_lutea.AAC.2
MVCKDHIGRHKHDDLLHTSAIALGLGLVRQRNASEAHRRLKSKPPIEVKLALSTVDSGGKHSAAFFQWSSEEALPCLCREN